MTRPSLAASLTASLTLSILFAGIPASAARAEQASAEDTMIVLEEGATPEDIVDVIELPPAVPPVPGEAGNQGAKGSSAKRENGRTFGESSGPSGTRPDDPRAMGSEAARQARAGASEAAREARNAASEAAEEAREAARSAADSARDAARDRRDEARGDDGRPGRPDHAGDR